MCDEGNPSAVRFYMFVFHILFLIILHNGRKKREIFIKKQMFLCFSVVEMQDENIKMVLRSAK